MSIDGCERLFAASGYDNRSKYTLDPASVVQWGSLFVGGLCIDTMSMHSETTPEDEQLGAMECVNHSTVVAAGHLLGELSKDIEDGVESRSAMVRMFSNYWHSTGKLDRKSVV